MPPHSHEKCVAAPLGHQTRRAPPTWCALRNRLPLLRLKGVAACGRASAPHPAVFPRYARCASDFLERRPLPPCVRVASAASALPIRSEAHHRLHFESQRRTVRQLHRLREEGGCPLPSYLEASAPQVLSGTCVPRSKSVARLRSRPCRAFRLLIVLRHHPQRARSPPLLCRGKPRLTLSGSIGPPGVRCALRPTWLSLPPCGISSETDKEDDRPSLSLQPTATSTRLPSLAPGL